jgi:Flp pilus assembly pilin Flp
MAQTGKTYIPRRRRSESGQALIEYALILVLVAIALAAALIATGPALGNVFSNTVYNLIGLEGTPQENLGTRGGPAAFWQTVTAVAMNPPEDREFPPNPPKPPEPTASPGPSPTPTEITPTVTPSFTPTLPPSPTPTDMAHLAPFEDPIDHPEWWRVDSSVWLGGEDWKGVYFANRDLNPPATITRYNGQLGQQYRFNLNFDWGGGPPLAGWTISDNFSVRWTRRVYIPENSPAITVNFSILSDDGVRLCVNKPGPDHACSDSGGQVLINQWVSRTFDSGPVTATYTFEPGEHWLTVEYYDATGNAGIRVDMSSFRSNVLGDTALPSGPANCQWARVTGSQPNTVAFAWEESPLSGNGFPPNMRCNLELRGYVDISALTTPQMSFWTVWDFKAGTTVSLQIAEYQPYTYDDNGTPTDPSDDIPTGGPNWAAGTNVPLFTGGTNYAWTKLTVPLPSVPSNQITYRFVVESNGASGIRRFYIDDIEVKDTPSGMVTVCSDDPGTCGSYWTLDDLGQMGDFITSGRWSLSSTNTADNSPMSWDVSAQTDRKYVRFGPEQGSADLRIHTIEFKGLINLPYNATGTDGAPDFEGDLGPPQLSFYHSYDLDKGESLEIQWTRDARDAVPDNWQTVETLVSTTSAATMQVMKLKEVPLNNIPNWNTQPFRLRFAFKVNANNTDRGGWWIDNITIDRKGRQGYNTYPFCETVENTTINPQWLISGYWGTATRGVFGSSRSFTDSPSGNYITGLETWIETKKVFDFNNDSPENLTVNGGNKDCSGNPSGAATNPTLTFWHQRSIGSSHSFTVDLYRQRRDAEGAIPATTEIPWTPIWSYSYSAAGSRTRINQAWERVEINIQAAIEQLTGQSWTALKTNNNPFDDDFYLRIRLDTRSGSGQGDGIYIDNIELKDYTENVFKLWDPSDNVTVPATQPPAGTGHGIRFSDTIDTPPEWWERWHTGGEWTGIDWDARSGLVSFHDHATKGETYRDKQFSVLEMNRIIDLRGTTTDDQPTLYFWNHYNIGSKDTIMVQVAVEDSSRTTQAYNYLRGWGSSTSYGSPNFSSWETIWSVGENSRVDTWVRQQISLNSYADNPSTGATNEGKRIRIRFVLDTYETSSNLREGWWIDDVRIEHRQPRIIGIPFFDAAQNTANWITEGIWGLAPDYWRGAGGGPAALGDEPWYAYYFDCIRWMTDFSGPPSGQIKTTLPTNGGTTISCNASNTSAFLNSIPHTKAAMDSWLAARPAWATNAQRFTGGTVESINHDYGTTGRPAGGSGSTWDNDYFARWYRHITVSAGDFTFITTSDDAVRLRYEGPGAPADWNIINNWSSHSRTVNFNTVTLAAGEYDLILEWFEGTGSAVIIVQIGNNNFSFSDSPKPTASDSVPAVPSVAYGNSSLILNGLINLFNPGVPSSAWRPRLQYYTYYQLPSGATARAEISIDGGFSWTTSNLSNNCPSGAQCNPIISGSASHLPTNGDWQLRSHDLRSYVNRNIGLRFRLNTTGNVGDGWWITEIQVNN